MDVSDMDRNSTDKNDDPAIKTTNVEVGDILVSSTLLLSLQLNVVDIIQTILSNNIRN